MTPGTRVRILRPDKPAHATGVVADPLGPCQTCTERGRRGYCAPLRCYCGHESCHAFASWREPAELNVAFIEPKATSSAWADREESTWIDNL